MLKGLVTLSSAPASSASTLLGSPSRADNTTIGTEVLATDGKADLIAMSAEVDVERPPDLLLIVDHQGSGSPIVVLGNVTSTAWVFPTPAPHPGTPGVDHAPSADSLVHNVGDLALVAPAASPSGLFYRTLTVISCMFGLGRPKYCHGRGRS